MLKLFTILLLVSIAIAVPLVDFELACAAETGASIEAFQNYRNNHSYDPEDHALKCMVKCTLQKESFVQADGVMDVAAAADYRMSIRRKNDNITWSGLVAYLQRCANTKIEGDDCEKGFYVGNCLIRKGNPS